MRMDAGVRYGKHTEEHERQHSVFLEEHAKKSILFLLECMARVASIAWAASKWGGIG